MAKILKQWEQGEFKDPKTGHNPNLDQISDAIGAAAQLEKDKEALKKRDAGGPGGLGGPGVGGDGVPPFAQQRGDIFIIFDQQDFFCHRLHSAILTF